MHYTTGNQINKLEIGKTSNVNVFVGTHQGIARILCHDTFCISTRMSIEHITLLCTSLYLLEPSIPLCFDVCYVICPHKAYF